MRGTIDSGFISMKSRVRELLNTHRTLIVVSIQRRNHVAMLSMVLASLFLIPVAYGLVTLSVTPSAVPTNGIVTISLCTTATDRLQMLLVVTPSGTVWKWTGGDVTLPTCPTTFNTNFGDSSLGWIKISGTGTTQTGESGSYQVQADYKHRQHGSEEFTVEIPFGVPEFGAPVTVLAALAFAAVMILRRRKSGLSRLD